MSKSGSRYGRRSNWFKIHCLLQEQQQDASKGVAKHSTPYQENLNLLSKIGGFPNVMFPPNRQKCSKEDRVSLTMTDRLNQQTAPPSVSSPESHNSDSSFENNSERRRLHFTDTTQNPSQIKATPPPPPSFPQSPHMLFPGHHIDPYFYHQHFIKPQMDLSFMHANIPANNNTQFIPNHNTKTDDEMRRRFYLDFLLKTQKLNPIKHEKDDQDVIPTITPPRSPSNTSSSQDSPIDLSIKTGQNTSNLTKDKRNDQSSSQHHDIHSQHYFHLENMTQHSNGHSSMVDNLNEDKDLNDQIKRMGKTPLDLTMKV